MSLYSLSLSLSPAAASSPCDFRHGFSPSHFWLGPLNRRAWHCGRRVGAKPRAPCVYLPLTAGLLREQDREGKRERERGRKQQRDRYRERKREKPGYRNENCLQCKQSSETSPRLPSSPLTYMALKITALL